MKNQFKFIALFLILFSSLTSCMKDEHKENLEKEIRLLEQYLLDNNYNVEPTSSGLYYIDLVEGSGAQPENGDFVLIDFTGIVMEGERVFGTTEYWIAEENNLVNSNFLYGPFKLQVGSISPFGIDEGIRMMKEGGMATMIFPSTLGFGRQPMGIIPAYSSLIYEVELVKVISDPVAYENELIQDYLDQNQYQVEPDENGVYYIETLEGDGQQPLSNNFVEVRYTCYMIDGRLAKSTGSQIHQINLASYLQGYINGTLTVKGFRDAIKKMKTGGRATVIVPYDQAFGIGSVDASGLGYKYPIPGYSTLVFEVELIAIK